MLFRRKAKAEETPAPFPGTDAALEGYVATLQIEQAASEALALQTASGWDPPARTGLASGFKAETCRRAPDTRALLGLLEGFTATGLRSAGFTDNLNAAIPALVQFAARRQPMVLHHLGHAGGEETAFDALSNNAPFLLYASNVQEAVDFALVAHYLAEQALSPGLCVQDAAATAASLQSLLLPEDALIATYLGRAGDTIKSPTPAQEILFGPERRRLPALLNLDRPMGIGVAYGPYADFLSQAAGSLYFLNHLGTLADEAFERYEELTGRRYRRVRGYRLKDAEYVLVAEGAIIEPLMEVVDYLRHDKGVRVGLLKINMRSPFPGPRVASLLRGRKGVTVVERAQPGLVGEASLLREVRAALERAAENGHSRWDSIPYPGYEAYERFADRPPLFAAAYGDELVPAFSELCALCMNMLANNTQSKRHVFLGVPFERPGVRLPKVERMQHLLHQGYPDLDQQSLPPLRVPPQREHAGLFALVAESKDTSFAAGRTFADACRIGLDNRIHTHTHVAHIQSLQPALFVTAHAPATDTLPSPAHAWDAALVSSPFFLSETHNLKERGLLVTHWNADQVAAQQGALARSLTTLRQKEVNVFALDAQKIAIGLSDKPNDYTLLKLAALYGAFIEKYPAFDGEHKADLKKQWLGAFTTTMELDERLTEALQKAVEQGATEVAELNVYDLVEVASASPEREAPWAVQAEQQVDGTLYDLGRFWDSTGYLFESGRQDQLLADPFLATSTMPARSSVIHDHAPFRDMLPQLQPDKCTACGTCWISCPDSALPVTVQDLNALIETAFSQCKTDGHTLLQLQRVQKHLAPLAQRLYAKADDPYTTLGPLLQDAFAGLLEKMKPKDDQRQALETEFGVLKAGVNTFPLSRTDAFFNTPEAAKKDSGLAFSLVLNPDACKACRTCVEVCPEGAMVTRPQTAERIDTARANWRFMRALPDTTPERIAASIDEDDPHTLANHLLSRSAYFATVGGDLTEPGSGKKTVVHLLAGLIEANLRPRLNGFIAEITDLMAGIEKKIETTLQDAVQVEDVASLSEKLGDLDVDNLDMGTLTPLLKAKGDKGIDRTWLAHMTESFKDLKALRDTYQASVDGGGRARLVMGIADNEVTRWARTFPHNPYPFPWICYASDSAAGLAEGLYEGVLQQMAASFKTIRLAQLRLKNAYKPHEHDAFFNQFGPHDLEEDELALCPPVMVMTSNDAGALDHLLNRDLPVKVLVVAEAHNLAERYPGGTPARSTALAAATYEDVYILQSSIGVPEHLMPGFLEGMNYAGPAVFYVYAPSPSRDAIPSHEVIPQSRRAVKSRAFPLFKFNPQAEGTLFDRFDLSMNANLDADWAQQEAGEETVAFTFADWAVHEGLLRHHFTPLAEGDGQANRVPLSDYLDLPEAERRGVVPVVQQPGKKTPLAVSDDMVTLTAWHRDRWRLLQLLPGHRPVLAVPEEEAESDVPSAEALQYHALLTQKLLAMSGFAPKTTAS